jgi:hypothetical protein
LVVLDQLELILGRRLREVIVNTRFRSNCRRCHVVVTGDHYRLDAHLSQIRESFADPAFDDVFELDRAKHRLIVGHHKRSTAPARDFFYCHANLRWEHTAKSLHVRLNGVSRAFSNFPRADIDPAHPDPRTERDGLRALQITAAKVEPLLGKNNDRPPFGRLVGQRC